MKKTLLEYLLEREALKEENGPRPLADDEGADDQDYIDLMGHYKHKARHELPYEEASEFLNHAISLKKEGDVSPKARTAGAYI